MVVVYYHRILVRNHNMLKISGLEMTVTVINGELRVYAWAVEND